MRQRATGEENYSGDEIEKLRVELVQVQSG